MISCDPVTEHTRDSARQTLRPSPPAYPSQVGIKTQELHLFQYFRSEVVAQLAGVFDEEYWLGALLQQAQTQAALWHTCNAVAAVHKLERLREHNETAIIGAERPLVLQPYQQYHFAIQQTKKLVVRGNLALADQENVAMVNLLFALMALLRGEISEFNMHMRNGMKLINGFKLWEHTRLYRPHEKNRLLPADSLLYMSLRLDSMSVLMRHMGHDDSPPFENCSLPLRDDPFISSTEAYLELELIYNAVTDTTICPGPKPRPPNYAVDQEDYADYYRPRLQKWEKKFGILKASCSASEKLGIAALELRAELLRMLLATQNELELLELRWDCAVTEFTSMVKHASEIILLRYARDKGGIKSRTMTVAPMVNEVLFAIVRLCRNSNIRREAMNLLQHDYHLSPVVDTLMFIQMAKVILGLEESRWNKEVQQQNSAEDCGCSQVEQSICHGHRVTMCCIESADRNKATLCLKTVSDVWHGYPWRKVQVLLPQSFKVNLTPLSEP